MYREIEGEDVILEKDPTYVLTVADIEQYASWLGMDLELDAHLFWIAKAGLMTELPEDWKPCKSPDGEVYYFNFASGESQWDHPCDEEFRELYREQRQISIVASQQRLAWAACVWATGKVLPSSSGELADTRERGIPREQIHITSKVWPRAEGRWVERSRTRQFSTRCGRA